jgi:hypothetical protein
VITIRRHKLAKRAKRITHDSCLGEIGKKYCKYCSQDCSWASVCVLIAMSHHILQDRTDIVPLSQRSFVPYYRF